MIDKKIEIATPELNLFPIQGKNIELSFSGDRISSDGGLLLLRELDNQLNLLSSAILDCDDTNNDTYGQQELALFNNYYNEYCYMPLHINEG
jgi:hypothetical protein